MTMPVGHYGFVAPPETVQMPTTLLRACLGLAAALTTAASLAQPARIDLQGHRGARWLLPENTLASFRKALEFNVTTLELDVAVTRDNVVVVSHDPALNPAITRDENGRHLSGTGPFIVQLSHAELRRFDLGRLDKSSSYGRNFPQQAEADGERMPTLGEVFELVKASGNTAVKFAIETKLSPLAPEATVAPGKMADLLLAEIDRHGMRDRVQILSFDWRSLQHIQQKNLGIPTVYVTAQLPSLDTIRAKGPEDSPWTAGFQYRTHGSIPKMIKAAGGTHWSSFWRELDTAQVREAQALGLKVLAWTVNDPKVFEQMLDLGVDGIVTDRPDMGAAILKRRQIEWAPR